MSRRLGFVALVLFALMVLPLTAQDEPAAPTRQQLDGAEHYLVKFEERVARAHGQPTTPGHDGNEAMERVAALYEQFPDHPKVQELFERTRQALLLSKGETFEITPEMLAYRENEEILRQRFFGVAQEQWAAYIEALDAEDNRLADAFPPPDWRETDMDDIVGKRVVLDAFEYPTNEFTDAGRQFVFVGTPSRGYYFVDLSGRAWPGVYEAVKRYRRFINSDVPEGMTWTLVGKITGLELLVPQAGEETTMTAQWGWRVEPQAVFLADRTFAMADPDNELGGFYAGEPEAEELKDSLYTVRSIPDDVTPERLTEIFATAIKEKNYPLYLECIDPDRRATRKALQRCLYHWEWHQHRFSEFYCHVVVGEADIYVAQGFDDSGSVEDVFLTEEDRAEIQEHAPPTIRRAELTTQAFDERGRQYGSPKPRFFKQVENGRWYITNYPQPF
jgi:hypothetical protein